MTPMLETTDRAERLVLVVEDDPELGKVLAQAIEAEEGYVALRVESAPEALDALHARRPDVIIVDVRLPGMSGLELYDHIRRDPRFRRLPVVVQTAAAREYFDELRRRRIATYLEKPFDIDDVLEFVKRLAPPPRLAGVH